MQNSDLSNHPKLYLAPLQGFTDFVFRKVYAEVFPWIDKFFVPYISVKNHEVVKKYVKEVLPENNRQPEVIPQVLAADTEEMIFLAEYLAEFGYNEINLNLGCPYPMVTNRGMGAGLLPFPEKIREILESFHEKSKQKLSVKLRAGLTSEKEIEKVIPVLNEFPLTEVILHPRIAKQMYSGEILFPVYETALKTLKHKLVYNGDIVGIEEFNHRQEKFPKTNSWMIGRGILMNPFLPSEIKGTVFSPGEKLQKLKVFHQLVLELYTEKMDNPGNVLNKMKQFWIYFSFAFPNQHKNLKIIKKASSLNRYLNETRNIFRDF